MIGFIAGIDLKISPFTGGNSQLVAPIVLCVVGMALDPVELEFMGRQRGVEALPQIPIQDLCFVCLLPASALP